MNYMPRIFIICRDAGARWGQGDVISTALAEDGHVLATHLSSSRGYAHHDMGLDGSKWKWDKYSARYPDGFELVWVENPDDLDSVIGLRRAVQANQRMAETEASDASS